MPKPRETDLATLMRACLPQIYDKKKGGYNKLQDKGTVFINVQIDPPGDEQ